MRIRDVSKLSPQKLKHESLYWKKFYISFSSYFYDELNAYDIYVGANFKLLRAFFNYLLNEKELSIGLYHERFYKPTEEIPVIVLSPERLNFLIYDEAFEKSLNWRQAMIKDIFVIGCTVALRYTDLIKINRTQIEKEGDRVYLVVRSQKTNSYTRVKLPAYAIRILEKYWDKKGKMFHYTHKFNFNKNLKKMARMAGWTEELPKTRNKRGIPHLIYKNEKTKRHYRFYDHICSHTMRRTAITTMLRMGMEEIHVRKVSGHAAHSGSFYRYVSYANAFIDEQLDGAFAKLDTFRAKNNNADKTNM